MVKKGRLCNQGCGTHLFFQKDENGVTRPYNMYDKEKHVCPMMEMAKFWGGRYNTIPMAPIKKKIEESYYAASEANKYRNIDQILEAIQDIVDNLQLVVFRMEGQEAQNKIWSEELDKYKKKLVEDQQRREDEYHGV